MATSKIESITKTEKTWTGQSGTMYDYTVSLEDGAAGTASSTSAEAPPYAVGDEVEYTKTENSFGVKLRIKKAGGNFGGGGGGFQKDPETIKRIENSWAIGTAVQILGQCQEGVSFTDYFKGVNNLATQLLTERDNLS